VEQTQPAPLAQDALAAARGALRRGSWQEARGLLKAIPDLEHNAAALEAYATSCWWLEDVPAMFDARERAFRLYRDQGDDVAAARMASALGMDYADFREELAVANGWFQRAESLLQGLDPCPEHAWLHLNRGVTALVLEGNLEHARRHQERALDLAQQLDIFDLRMLALTLDGLILVREGRISEGMRRMDEATAAAISGEMTDLSAVGNACCAVIYACESVADYERAAQWCERAKEFSRRWGLASLFAICRSYYATVLIWRGEWADAEKELTASAAELESTRPASALEALAKLGELRRRQGRHAEAQELFRRAEAHPMSLLGKAAIAVDKSDPSSALDLVRRFLRRITSEDQAEHVFALELAVRARLQKGDVEGAARDLADASAIAEAVGTHCLMASAHLSKGLLSEAQGDLERSKDRFEDAVDLFLATGNAFDAARARLDLARTLSRLGRPDAAIEQATLARETFQKLGASHHALLAAGAVTGGGRAVLEASGQRFPGLSPRESEVLWLLAAGKTNQEIAEDLVLSIRTVERHISTIYEKIDAHGKAARAAATAFALRQRQSSSDTQTAYV
jgi:LuxR family maltose regulon positive regulatory protein